MANPFDGELNLIYLDSGTEYIIYIGQVRQEDKDEELLKFIEDMQPDDKVMFYVHAFI